MYRVGVDLGGTNIVAGVINEEMKIIGRGKLKTNCPRAAEAILEDVAKAVEAAVIDAGITMNDVVSVGIGTPGSVNKKNGVIEYANNLAFDNVPARDILESRLKKTIYLDNDANCAALGEAKAGAGKGVNSFVAITLGTGVGGGIGHEKENLLVPLRKMVERERYSIHAKVQTQIISAELGNDAGLIGAALLDR